jgi:hypothetical protein
MLEPLVLLELDGAGLAEVLANRDRHAALADAAADPHAARRHRWHAFEVLTDPQVAPRLSRPLAAALPLALLVPASWSGGYAGYGAFARARILAEPGMHLVELLLAASRERNPERDGEARGPHTDGTRR